MSHLYFANASLFLSTGLVLLGLNGMIRPEAHLGALQFRVPADPTAKKLSYALMRIWGVRNITVGSLLTLIWKTGDEKLLATGLGAGVALATTDGFVSRLLIGGGATQHWIVPPILGVIMAGLYGWFD
ncbi:hypothetical protein NLG97_g536 [Lecanicillium saksenae]|uniref:Uncharacterized protein n=1 Tax=Lecanicillium saksenae TaxID=468837 RepID=A0ACC1R6W7_9HYPO|nr:hypothetical protein NLG97_g536 [Lecanicillium saksenae]